MAGGIATHVPPIGGAWTPFFQVIAARPEPTAQGLRQFLLSGQGGQWPRRNARMARMNGNDEKATRRSGRGWQVALMAAGAALAYACCRSKAEQAAQAHARERLALVERAERLDHDLRTPVGTLAAALELLRTEPPGSEMAGETLDVIDRQVARMRLLVHELKDFTRELQR
jgi:signal transduction histidine kinase